MVLGNLVRQPDARTAGKGFPWSENGASIGPLIDAVAPTDSRNGIF